MRLVLFLLLLAALVTACSSTRVQAGSDGKARVYANTSVVLVEYEGGLHASIVDVGSGEILEELRLDGSGSRAWRRTGALSFRWAAMDPSEARRLLGLPPVGTPVPAPTPSLAGQQTRAVESACDRAWLGRVSGGTRAAPRIEWEPVDPDEARRMLWLWPMTLAGEGTS